VPATPGVIAGAAAEIEQRLTQVCGDGSVNATGRLQREENCGGRKSETLTRESEHSKGRDGIDPGFLLLEMHRRHYACLADQQSLLHRKISRLTQVKTVLQASNVGKSGTRERLNTRRFRRAGKPAIGD